MQLMNTAFLLISLMGNKFKLEENIINSIFKFNLKKKKIIMKFQKINDIEGLNLSTSQLPNFNFKKSTNITRPLELDNKSKNSFIKDNEVNNISFLNLSEYKKNDLENKSRSTILKKPKKNNIINIIPYENSKIEQNQNIFTKKLMGLSQEQNKENGTNFNIFSKKNNTGEIFYKDYNDKIELNIFDYCCCYLIQRKRHRNIELFNMANSFYRKKFDVVNAFNLLLLSEKILLRNNYEYFQSLNEEIENFYQKK